MFDRLEGPECFDCCDHSAFSDEQEHLTIDRGEDEFTLLDEPNVLVLPHAYFSVSSSVTLYICTKCFVVSCKIDQTLVDVALTRAHLSDRIVPES